MSFSRRTARHGQTVALSHAQAFNGLVLANAFGAAQELLKDLDDEHLEHCIEEIRVLMHDQGIELPDWERLSEHELRKIALGAFRLRDGKVVLTTDA
jgi:hypothetical protein